MSRVPSSNVLAKDVIGYAQELISEENARLLIKNLGINYYNSAIMEVYNIIMIMSPNMFDFFANISATESNLQLLAGTKIYRGSLENANFSRYDEILNIRCFNNAIFTQTHLITPEEMNTYFETDGCGFPYSDSVVCCVNESSIDFCFGEELDVSTPVFTVRFRRVPEQMTTTNYDTLMMGVPDKYFPIVTNRIASYAEIRRGIKDNSLAIVKVLYEQMISSLSPELQIKIRNKLNIGA